MAGIILGVISMIGGVISLIYGMNLNNDTEERLKSYFSGNGTEPGNDYIIIGVVCIVLGIILLIIGAVRESNKKSTQESNSNQFYYPNNVQYPNQNMYGNYYNQNTPVANNINRQNQNYTAQNNQQIYAEPQKQIQFCPYCGAKLKPGSKFCSVCGSKISPN